MRQQAKDLSNRSRYLWTDLLEASDILAGRNLRSGAQIIGQFIEQGFSTRSAAVPLYDIDRFLKDITAELDSPKTKLFVTFWDQSGKQMLPARKEFLSKPEAKVLDVHYHVADSHALIFAPQIMDFLWDVFEEPPVAFQSLYFEYGSAQGAHNDTAFVYVDPPNKFVASWIALEDIEPNTGELFYYPGSHKIGDQIFCNGRKTFDSSDEHASSYSQTLEEFLKGHGLARSTFLPRKSDVLFWASDLVHGGSCHSSHHTRRSLVTHYHPLSAITPYAKGSRSKPVLTNTGGWVVSAT